jgi:asparagine synthase (glutamine-hydrolysing)
MVRHRGPDASGFFLENGCALGHARLSIIDLSGGDQPMANEDGSLHIVFNGEIFNYIELRRELLAHGHQFATRSDTEVILHLFEERGEECVHYMNGQWAFAIWNSKARSLFVSRDRIGVRPLFYTSVDGTFLFGSEIKALFAYPGVNRTLDHEALNEVFTFWHTIPPRTAFRGVFELPPGSSGYVSDGSIAIKQYWDLDYAPAPTPQGRDQEQQYAEELMAILEDAVRLRLRSDVPVGAYLSGGLDSSVITSVIHRAAPSRLKTFSLRFDENELDEGPFQQEVVRQLGTDHQEVRCSNTDVASFFPCAMWHIEKPVLRAAPVPLYLLSRLVRQNGYKVVLTGEGSDEMLGGYDIFKEVKIRSFWAAMPSSPKRPMLLRRLYPYMPQLQSQSAAYLKAFFHISSTDIESPFFSHLPRWRLTTKLKSFFSDSVKAELKSSDSMHGLRVLLPQCYHQWDPFTRAQYLESRFLLPGYILSSQGDRVAMAHSVEGRFPFLDHRLVEFASRLPARLKMCALQEKYLLKKCARRLVPPAVLARPKQPYRAPDAKSFFSNQGHDYVNELLSAAQIRRIGVFHPAAVEKLIEKARAGSVTSVADNMAVVGILSTQLVAHQFVSSFPTT